MHKKLRPAWAEVDLGAVERNFAQVKRTVGEGTGALVVVKAEAYGHGLLAVSRRLVERGVDYLGVACVDEAVAIRKELGEVRVPILILGPVLPDEIDAILKYDLTQSVTDESLAKALQEAGARKNAKVKTHIKVDTGMGRVGVWHEEAGDFIKWAKQQGALDVEGVFTHFSSAEEEDSTFTGEQINSFKKVLDKIDKSGITVRYAHAANSMGLVGFKDAHLNLIRPGLIIYGMHPRPDVADSLKLEPALTLKSRIVFLKEVPEGRHISYGRTHTTSRVTKIATLAIGYGDGYPRALSNKAHCLVGGVRVPVVGNICMDHTMIDVGDVENVKVGDEVVLIGSQGSEKITAEEIATLAGTIPYEITCRISPRVARIYKG